VTTFTGATTLIEGILILKWPKVISTPNLPTNLEHSWKHINLFWIKY
jgi:hypothetical protein